MARFTEGDTLCGDDDGELVIKGHITLEEYNRILDVDYEQLPVTAVRHYYVRIIPAQPDEGVAYWVHDWGNKPARGALKATERAVPRG